MAELLTPLVVAPVSSLASSKNTTSLLCEPVSTATSSVSAASSSKRIQQRTSDAISQDVLYPAYTDDYRIVKGSRAGLGMVANRDMKKGEMVLKDSIEFLFADVQEGDNIILVGHELASLESEVPVPSRLPLTRDMLIRTHGVPVLREDPDDPESAGIESYRLEVPWMLLNHSCDPNVIDSSHKEPEGEAIAARDIKRGEELTYDYTHQYYDKTLHSFECLCGASNCRKLVTGFAGLSEDDKVRLWPHVSDYIKVQHTADSGNGPKTRVQHPTFPERKLSSPGTMRMVVPGPSCSGSEIAIRRNGDKFQLVATKDFDFGEKVYQFWNFIWPEQGTVDIDMVAASDLYDCDAPEGTVIRVTPQEHGVRDSMGRYRFSGYNMMLEHSCEPNLVYNYKDEDEEDDWRSTYAAKPIKRGDVLTVDFNTVWNDRSDVANTTGVCQCGAKTCRGTVMGFSHLPRKQQEELKSFSWLRISPPYEGETRLVSTGDALSPHINRCMKKSLDSTDVTDCSDTASNVSSSFDGDLSSGEE